MKLSLLSVLFCLLFALAEVNASGFHTQVLAKRGETAVERTTCTKKGTLALTFDDGPYSPFTPSILDTLKKYNAKATFFVNGNNWQCIYNNAALLRRIYNEGHLIGSHTWSHPDSVTLSDAEFTQQLTLLEEAFIKILGVTPKYFRAPYGSINDRILKILKKHGYEHILWDFDSRDSLGDSEAQIKASVTKLAKTYPKPHIFLGHDVQQKTVHTLSYNAKTLKSAGYKLVTVAQCLGRTAKTQWYNLKDSNGKPFKRESRNSSWTCAGKVSP